eukprot:scaffold21819_cov18-Tisochrysis_lutea.AAC.2
MLSCLDLITANASPMTNNPSHKPFRNTDQPDAEEETMPAVVACGAHHSTAISRKVCVNGHGQSSGQGIAAILPHAPDCCGLIFCSS